MAPWMAWAVYSLALVASVVASVAFHEASLTARVIIAVVAGLILRLLQCLILGPHAPLLRPLVHSAQCDGCLLSSD